MSNELDIHGTNRTEADAIIEAVKELTKPVVEPLGRDGWETAGIVGLASWLVDGNHVALDVEQFLPQPRSMESVTEVWDLPDLVTLLDEYPDTEAMSTTVFVDRRALQVVAILDDHRRGEPGWRRTRIQWQAKVSSELSRWINVDRELLNQTEFAELIEDRLPDILDPEPATLLEIAQTLTGSTALSWRSAKRLADGQSQMAWTEETEAAAGTSGQLTIPAKIVLYLPILDGGEPVEVTARLRYRIASGNVRLGIVLDQTEDRVRREFDTLTAALTDLPDATGCLLVAGPPPAPNRTVPTIRTLT